MGHLAALGGAAGAGRPALRRRAHHLRRPATGRATSPGTGWRPTVDSGIIAAFRGDFARPTSGSPCSTDHADRAHPSSPSWAHHLRWSRLLLQGRFAEADALLDGLAPTDYPYRRAAAGDHRRRARRRRDGGPADRRHRGRRHPRTRVRCRRCGCGCGRRPPPRPATRERCDAARAALAPHRGEWMVGAVRLRHQRPGRPLAGAGRRRRGPLGRRHRRLHGRPGRPPTGWAPALVAAGPRRPRERPRRPGPPGRRRDAGRAARRRRPARRPALGMTQVLHRLAAPTAPDRRPTGRRPARASVGGRAPGRRAGPGCPARRVGRLARPARPRRSRPSSRGTSSGATGRSGSSRTTVSVVHLPDAKGLRDLHAAAEPARAATCPPSSCSTRRPGRSWSPPAGWAPTRSSTTRRRPATGGTWPRLDDEIDRAAAARRRPAGWPRWTPNGARCSTSCVPPPGWAAAAAAWATRPSGPARR